MPAIAGKLREIIRILEGKYSKGGLVFRYSDPFKVFISAFLSSRTKDEVTKAACERLCSKYKSFEELLAADVEEIEKLIFPVGFYRQKARRLKEIARIVVEKYGGGIPTSKEELMKLPGVGLKIATLVAQILGNEPEVCVDTHVHRILNRLGIVKTKRPEETYRVLMRIVDPKDRGKINRIFVPFGKEICRPKKPICEICPIKHLCASYKRLKGMEV